MDLRGLGSMLDTMRATGTPGRPGAVAPGGAGRAGQAGAAQGVEPGSFGKALAGALGEVSKVQNESTALQRAYAAGDPNVSLEQTMLAMQKSQVAFQAATTVRNRLVSAYTDIMNMNV